MIFKDYYRILDLKNNKATTEEIKIAFREQAKKYHPDVNNGKTTERFKDINEAYKILSKVGTRKKYDRSWMAYVGKKQNIKEKREKGDIAKDFVNMFFKVEIEDKKKIEKANKKLATKGESIQTEISVKIEEAFLGITKKISLRAIDGSMKSFDVKIPAGIRNGEKIRLIGQGKAGSNGGKNGDLYIKINIKDDNKFKLNGYDLETNLYLSPWEAALGKKVNIESLDGNIALCIPAGIQSGEKIKVPNKGYQDGFGNRGNLVAEIRTIVPKKLTEEEKQLFEQLQEISKFSPRGNN